MERLRTNVLVPQALAPIRTGWPQLPRSLPPRFELHDTQPAPDGSPWRHPDVSTSSFGPTRKMPVVSRSRSRLRRGPLDIFRDSPCAISRSCLKSLPGAGRIPQPGGWMLSRQCAVPRGPPPRIDTAEGGKSVCARVRETPAAPIGPWSLVRRCSVDALIMRGPRSDNTFVDAWTPRGAPDGPVPLADAVPRRHNRSPAARTRPRS